VFDSTVTIMQWEAESEKIKAAMPSR